jgi:fatty-acyl-CoA synthase
MSTLYKVELLNERTAASVVERFFERISCTGSCCVLERTHKDVIDSSKLWATVQECRAVLRSHGLQRGAVVAIGMPTCNHVLAMLLATWAEGITVAMLPYDVSENSGHLSSSKFKQMLELVSPNCLLLSDGLLEHVPSAFKEKAFTFESFQKQMREVEPTTGGPIVRGDDIAILQFTSGSTGFPKAAVITQAMLAANCAAIAERISMNSNDKMVSWLPMHHDMGLSAVTLAWWGGIDLIMMPTAMFIRQPLSWLETISTHKATLSPAPASAYAILSRFARSATARKFDLSTWRYAWAGAEPVFHKHMQNFVDSMQNFGLRRNVIQPAYGMAESVVAVSLNAPGELYRALWVDALALSDMGCIEIRMPNSSGASVYVSNGRPISGMQIAVRDEEGNSLATGRSGVLHIRGPSVIQNYLGEACVCDGAGWYDTGDIGFLHEGELYICGRAKDVITRAGRNISPQEIEWVVEETLALRQGSAAAFSYNDHTLGQERIVVVVAKFLEAADIEKVRQQIATATARSAGIQLDDIVFVKRSDLSKTTSGKLQRSILRSAYLRGELTSPSLVSETA